MHATLLSERLDRLRYESLLVCGVESTREGNYLSLYHRNVEGLTVLPELGREIHPLRDVVTLLRLYRVIRLVRPDIVHTHTAKAGAVGRLAAWLARVPVVVHTFHGHVLEGYFPPWKTRLFTSIERWLARITDRLIVVSKAVQDDLLSRGVGSPQGISVIPLGLDLAPFLCSEVLRGRLREELKIGADSPLIGIVARLAPIKRHEDFLEAAALISRQLSTSRFLVVGDGEQKNKLAARTERLGLDGKVYFLGWRNDLDRIYADLDLVLLTSANEGSPVALIEAMAAARPVIATRVGGVPDLVDDGVSGILVPPRDPTALATATLKLLGEPELRRTMGAAGRQRVYPAFAIERLLDDVDDLYTGLLRLKRLESVNCKCKLGCR